MWIRLKNFLRLKGTWAWTMERLKEGNIVYRTTDSVSVKYRLDKENQGRIQWCFTRDPFDDPSNQWECAKIFMSDFTTTSWDVY